MNINFFRDKNGNLSSTRTTFGSGDNKISITEYADGKNGGITMYTKNSVLRVNNQGSIIGSGFRVGNRISYIDKHGNVSNTIPSFI